MAQANNNTRVVTLIPPAIAAAATAVTTAYVDMQDADYCTIHVNTSSEKNTDATGPVLRLAAGDTTTFASAATVVADVTLVDQTVAGGHVYHVDGRGQKRYLFLRVTPDTTTNGNIAFAATAVKSRVKIGNPSTTEMTDNSTNGSSTTKIGATVV